MRNHLIAGALVASALALAATVPGYAAATTRTVTRPAPTLYVDNQISGTVTPISTVTNTPGKAIRTGNTPWSIVCAPTVCRSASTAG